MVNKIFCFVLCMTLCPVISYGQRQNLKYKKIFIVHSYHEDFEWTRQLHFGIKKIFQDKGFYFIEDESNEFSNVRVRYMDSKRDDNKQRLFNLSRKILDEIRNFDPDAIIVSDDDALKNVGFPLQNGPYPIIFCGINSDPVKAKIIQSLESSENFITGILEQYPLHSMFKLGKKLLPNAKKVYFFFDNSITGQALLNNYKKQISLDKLNEILANDDLFIIDMHISNSWQTWKNKLSKINPKESLVYLQAFFNTRDEDGNMVPYQKVAKWIDENTQVANFSVANFSMLDGFLGSFAFSGYDQGESAAEIALRAISGIHPKNIPITVPRNYRLYINKKRADAIGMKVPLDLLTYSEKNWDDYHLKGAASNQADLK